jgi:hypothetical protein
MGVGSGNKSPSRADLDYSQATAILYNEISLIDEGRMLVRVWLFFYVMLTLLLKG